MRVNNIFRSIQGEGVLAGVSMIFIRLQGCNLRCTYCDTGYAQDPAGGEEMTIPVLVDRVRQLRCSDWYCITGGDPLCQVEELYELVRRLRCPAHMVEVEENGSIDPPSWFKLVDSWSIDVKCPSSGPSYGAFRPKWLKKLRKRDQLKFVVGNREDLDFVRGFLNGTKLRPAILVSPVIPVCAPALRGIDTAWLQEVWEFCCEVDVRFSLQIHKVVYGDRKGV